MDCAILTLKSALETLENPESLARIREKTPGITDEELQKTVAKAKEDHEQALVVLLMYQFTVENSIAIEYADEPAMVLNVSKISWGDPTGKGDKDKGWN